MYIAGLKLHIHHTQGVEGLIAASTFAGFFFFLRTQRRLAHKSYAEAGPLVTKIPRSAHIATSVHALAFFVPPIAYVFGVALNGFDRPEWLEETSLPFEWEFRLGMGGYSAVRSLAAFAMAVLLPSGLSWCSKHLGAQWSPIGLRAKPEVITSGPYAYVRHPMYTCVLTTELLFSAMFWSWAPLVAMGITAGAFAVKIPTEESLIMEHPEITASYTAYKANVPYRLIPYIW